MTKNVDRLASTLCGPSIAPLRRVAADLPERGFVRLAVVLAVFPVGRSTWYDGVRRGKYPPPVRLGPRTSAYRVEDIRRLIEQHEQAGA